MALKITKKKTRQNLVPLKEIVPSLKRNYLLSVARHLLVELLQAN